MVPIFGMMQRLGNVDEKEMFRTFNMGIGMVVVCPESSKNSIVKLIKDYFEIGRITTGKASVDIKS